MNYYLCCGFSGEDCEHMIVRWFNAESHEEAMGLAVRCGEFRPHSLVSVVQVNKDDIRDFRLTVGFKEEER